MAITKIQSESLNLADTYAFTGTVTGAGGANTPAFQAYKSANQAISGSTWTKIQFNDLVNMEPIKNKDLSAIDSGKRHTPYHKFRADLITSFLKKHPKEIDGYGHICNNVLPYRDKTKGLMDYRYNLVLENGKTDFYFSEKFCDPLLFLTMPIYKGCKKIDKFFPTINKNLVLKE